jgi:hypothetical protein
VEAVNKKAVEQILAHAIKQTSLSNDVETLHKSAQDIVDAGYELEDMKITPAFMQAIMSQLVETGWVPEFKEQK